MTTSREAALIGLMLGESLSARSLHDRSHLLPFWTRRKRREIEADAERDRLLEPGLPFALNQPTAAFETGPGPHGEWVAFQLQVLLDGRGRYDPDVALTNWQALADDRAALRLTVAQHAALANLARGLLPPQCGHDNPHYFDDSACFRALALALAKPRGTLADAVAQDACITNAEDGVWAAQAYAAAVAAALAGAPPHEAVAAARQALPHTSWIAHEVARACAAAQQATSVFDLIHRLSDEAVNHAYNYGNSAPESLALVLAILTHTEGAAEPSLLAALGLPKTAGSVTPLLGALCGALGANLSLSSEHRTLRGIALPSLKGRDPFALLADLTALTT